MPMSQMAWNSKRLSSAWCVLPFILSNNPLRLCTISIQIPKIIWASLSVTFCNTFKHWVVTWFHSSFSRFVLLANYPLHSTSFGQWQDVEASSAPSTLARYKNTYQLGSNFSIEPCNPSRLWSTSMTSCWQLLKMC